MRTRVLLIWDLVAVALAASTASLVTPVGEQAALARGYLAAALLVKPIVLWMLGAYRPVWQYAGGRDLTRVAVAAVASTAAMQTLARAGGLGFALAAAPAFVVIDGLATLLLVASPRLAMSFGGGRRIASGAGRGGAPRRVLIIGAGDTGAMVVREMVRRPDLGMRPVGFLDDDHQKVGREICGVPVVGYVSTLPLATRTHRVDEVVVAMPRAAGHVLRAVAEMCRAAEVEFRTMPGIYELLDGNVSVSRLRRVDIADLLRRSQVAIEASHPYLADQCVLVTGAGGSIGREICQQVAHARPARLLLLGHGENSIFEAEQALREAYPGVPARPIVADVRDEARMARLFATHCPDVVFHAAAHKHVPLMEGCPEEAVTNNVLGTANLVRLSLAHEVQRFVLISTDKAVSPTNVMGASKRVAEAIVRDAARRRGRGFVVVRFGNVLGSRGSAIPIFQRQIERGGPLRLTHPEMRRYFMTVSEAVHLALQAGGLGSGGELFVLDMGAPVRIVDLARDLIRLSGFEPADVPLVFTGPRPGEKLEEALWEGGARVAVTSRPGVLTVSEDEQWTGVELSRTITGLERAAARGDALQILALLAEFIPSFVPMSAVETDIVRAS